MEIFSSHLMNVISKINYFFKQKIQVKLSNAKRKGDHAFYNLFDDERNELYVLVALPNFY